MKTFNSERTPFAVDVNTRLKREEASRHEHACVLSFEVIDVSSIAVDFLTDRVTRTVSEVLSESGIAHNFPANIVDFPTRHLAPGTEPVIHKIETGTPGITDRMKGFYVFLRRLVAYICTPGYVVVD